jgi:hypothetical protein
MLHLSRHEILVRVTLPRRILERRRMVKLEERPYEIFMSVSIYVEKNVLNILRIDKSGRLVGRRVLNYHQSLCHYTVV